MLKTTAFALILVFLIVAVIVYPIIRTRMSPSATRAAGKQNGAGDRLFRHVRNLSVHIGSRSIEEYERLEEAKNYILSSLREHGFAPSVQEFVYRGKTFSNIEAVIHGQAVPDEVIVIGAHYDTVPGTPGADDNASAVALLLELCRNLAGYQSARTLKLVFFSLEERPAFSTPHMGSGVYAARAKSAGEDIKAMISLEMLGYYDSSKGGQNFPLPFMGRLFSDIPNFVAVVGNRDSRDLVLNVRDSLGRCGVPVESIAASRWIPGVDLSDHRSFWKEGYQAVMLTDTAFYRNPNYHTANDTIETLDFRAMQALLRGLEETVRTLSQGRLRGAG